MILSGCFRRLGRSLEREAPGSGEDERVRVDLDGAVPAVAVPEQYAGHADQKLGHVTYSQCGQDLIVSAMLEKLGIETPIYVDVGAHHPLNISNTALLHARGGRGLNIEANPILFEAFPQARPGDINVNVGVGAAEGVLTFYMIDDWSGRNTFDRDLAEAFVRDHPQFKISRTQDIEVRPLDSILSEHSVSLPRIDFLSMDVEGLDTEVICAMALEEFRPKIICIETNSKGSRDHLLRKDYALIIRVGEDNIYVDRAHLEAVRPSYPS